MLRTFEIVERGRVSRRALGISPGQAQDRPVAKPNPLHDGVGDTFVLSSMDVSHQPEGIGDTFALSCGHNSSCILIAPEQTETEVGQKCGDLTAVRFVGVNFNELPGSLP